MNATLSDTLGPSAAPDTSENTPEVDIILGSFEEPNYRRFLRVLCAVVIGGMALVFFWGAGDAGLIWFFVSLTFLWSISRRLYQRKSILITNQNVGTVGGKLDQRVAWNAVRSIEVVGQVVELRFPGGKHSIVLTILDPAVRDDAATAIIRCFEMYRYAGPFILPLEEALEIRSERLEIRPLRTSDLSFVADLFTSAERVDRQLSVITSRELVALAAAAPFKKGCSKSNYGRLVICEGANAIGMLYFSPCDLILRHATVGIDILPEFCNRGYGTEAMRAVLAFLGSESNLTRISAGCFSDNHACRRILEKSGMTHVGTQRRFWLKGDTWKDGEMFEHIFEQTAVVGRD